MRVPVMVVVVVCCACTCTHRQVRLALWPGCTHPVGRQIGSTPKQVVDETGDQVGLQVFGRQIRWQKHTSSGIHSSQAGAGVLSHKPRRSL